MSDYDLDEDESNDYQDFEERESDEDTEDASETDMIRLEGEFTEIKEQIYLDKFNNLKDQLHQLNNELHPEYLRKLKKLEIIYEDRMWLNDAFYAFETERIEKEYISEKRASAREFEDRKIELKENLIIELEEKRRIIESERTTLELTSDSIEPKPVTTRKLRRRPNDPIPVPEKRKRGSPAQLNHLLDENEILEDLKALSKACNLKFAVESQSDSDSSPNIVEARIEDGKLNYDKKWYHRGQPVLIRSRDGLEFNGVLASIGTTEIWLKKVTDNSKFRVYLSNLQKGKYTLQRRAS